MAIESRDLDKKKCGARRIGLLKWYLRFCFIWWWFLNDKFFIGVSYEISWGSSLKPTIGRLKLEKNHIFSSNIFSWKQLIFMIFDHSFFPIALQKIQHLCSHRSRIGSLRSKMCLKRRIFDTETSRMCMKFLSKIHALKIIALISNNTPLSMPHFAIFVYCFETRFCFKVNLYRDSVFLTVKKYERLCSVFIQKMCESDLWISIGYCTGFPSPVYNFRRIGVKRWIHNA